MEKTKNVLALLPHMRRLKNLVWKAELPLDARARFAKLPLEEVFITSDKSPKLDELSPRRLQCFAWDLRDRATRELRG